MRTLCFKVVLKMFCSVGFYCKYIPHPFPGVSFLSDFFKKLPFVLGPRFDTIGPVEQNENDLLQAGLGLTQASKCRQSRRLRPRDC